MSPIAKVFSALVGLGSFVLLFFFGLAMGAVLLVAGLAVALYLRIRLWLARRNGTVPAAGRAQPGQIIEGQFHVVQSSNKDTDGADQ